MHEHDPIHRLRLAVGEAADAGALYVRSLDLSVERLEQQYRRLNDDGLIYGSTIVRRDSATPTSTPLSAGNREI